MAVRSTNTYNVSYRHREGTMVGRIEHFENWCALAIAVITDTNADNAMLAMGIRPATHHKYPKKCKYKFGKPKDIECLCYVLSKFCGLSYNQLANAVGMKVGTVHTVLRNFKRKVLSNDGTTKRQTAI